MGLQRRQIIKEAVRVVEYLDAVAVELGSGSEVSVVFGEDGVLGVEAVEQPQEPLLVGLLFLDLLQQCSDRDQGLVVPFSGAVEGLGCNIDVR